MDTLNISNAFLGSTNITAMWLSGSKVWPQSTTPIIAEYSLVLEGYSGSQANFTSTITGTPSYTISSYTVTAGTASIQFASGSKYMFKNLASYTTNGVFAPYQVTSVQAGTALTALGQYSLSICRFMRRLEAPGVKTMNASLNESFLLEKLNVPGFVSASGRYNMSGLGQNITTAATYSFESLGYIDAVENFGTNTRARFYNLPELTNMDASNIWFNNTGVTGIYAPKLTKVAAGAFGSIGNTAGRTIWVNSNITASSIWNSTAVTGLSAWNKIYVNN